MENNSEEKILTESKYCQKCGKQIKIDAKFCEYCGNNQNEVIKKEDENKLYKEDKESMNCIIPLIILLLFIAFIIVFVVVGINLYKGKITDTSNNQSITLIQRKAVSADISLKQDNDLSFSTTFIMTPKYDIDNLEITINFYDENGKNTVSKVEKIGNVTKNKNYKFSFTISELGLETTLNIEKYNYEVTNGTIKP